MKKILTSQDIALVGFYKNILEDNGINAVVKNYYLTSGMGDIPPYDTIPELWILDEDKEEMAKSLLADVKNPPWTCKCGEMIDGQFEQCWKCGNNRP